MRTPTKAAHASPHGSTDADSTRGLAGLRVLIVEDVGMVAMALKALLEELGCVVVGTAARLSEAETLARDAELDGVLLDLNLGGQYSFPVAEILRGRGIPFIIMSGYDAGQLLPELAGVPQMQKPFEVERLRTLMTTAFIPRGGGGSPARAGPRPKAAQGEGAAAATPTKTRGEIEAAVCHGLQRFEQEYLGRGPTDIHAHLLGDFLIVRLQGVLTAAEKQLAQSAPQEKGRDLLKQVRTQLIETARLQIDSMIQVITGVRVNSLHHDISTVTGEEVVVFTLDRAPSCREAGQR